MQSKHFEVHELVPSGIFHRFGDGSWKFINPDIIKVIDRLKEYFPKGTMTINNYFWNGDREWSGLRTPESPYYSETSQHSLGNAVDIIFSDYDVEEVRKFILDNPELFPEIKGIELDVNWLHIDCRNEDRLVVFTA